MALYVILLSAGVVGLRVAGLWTPSLGIALLSVSIGYMITLEASMFVVVEGTGRTARRYAFALVATVVLLGWLLGVPRWIDETKYPYLNSALLIGGLLVLLLLMAHLARRWNIGRMRE
jgi:hypothetical protein